MADNNTEFGILIRAVDQATSTLKSVAAELERLQRSQNSASKSADSMSASHAKLGGILSSVQQQLTKTNPVMGQFATQIAEVADASGGVGGPLAGIATGLAAIAVSSVIAAHSIGDYQEKMDIASQITGLTQSQIGGLTVMLSNVGRSFDSIQPSLIIFNRKLEEAKEGSGTAARAFERLKGPQGQLIDTTQSTSKVFEQVIGSLSKIPDSSERARLAFQLFGRGGTALLTILNQDLTESEKIAEKLGIVLSPAAQKVARDADAAGDKLRLSFTGMMNTITVALAPLGTTLIGLVDKFVQSLKGLVDALNGTHTAAAKVNMESAAAQLDLIGQSADRNQKHVKALKDELIRLQMQQREGGFQTPDVSNVPGINPNDPRFVPGKVSRVAPSPDAGPLSQYILGLLKVDDTTKKVVASAHELTDEQLSQLIATKKQIGQLADMVALGAIDKVQEFDTLFSMKAQSQSKENLVALQDRLNAITGDYLGLEHSAKFIKEQDLKTIRDAGFALNDQIRTLDRRQSVNIITLDAEIAQLEAKKASTESAKQLLQIEEKISALLQKRAVENKFTPIEPFGGLPGPEASSPKGEPPKQKQFPDLPPTDFFEAFNRELREINDSAQDAGGAFVQFGKDLARLVAPFRSISAAITTIGVVIANTFVNQFGSAVKALVSGTINIGQAFHQLITSMIQAIAEMAARAAAVGFIKAAISFVAPEAAPVLLATSDFRNSQDGGTAVKAQSGGSILAQAGGTPVQTNPGETLFAQAGGTAVPAQSGEILLAKAGETSVKAQSGGSILAQAGGSILAQSGASLSKSENLVRSQYSGMSSARRSGMIVTGARGADTISARVGRGETILSHELTDLNSRVMRKMDTFLNQMSQPRDSGGQKSIVLSPEFHFHAAVIDRNTLKSFVSDQIVPEMRNLINSGSTR